MRHKYKILKYKNKKIPIDEEIALLFSNLWKLDILTNGSCQAVCNFRCKHKIKEYSPDKDGLIYLEKIKTKHCNDCVWISFVSTQDIETFLNYVAEYGTEMYSCVLGLNSKNYPHDIWSTAYFPDNYGIKGHWGKPYFKNGKRSTQQLWIEDGCKKNNFIIQPQLTFPRIHLPYVEEKIQLALSKKY